MASSAMATADGAMPPSRLYRHLDIAGKRAVITGATSGIGLQIALRLAELKCNLVLVGRRTERLQDLKKQILSYDFYGSEEATNAAVELETMDVTDKAAVEALAAKFAEKTEILVNNAGLALGAAAADETPYDDMFTMFNTNIIASAHMTQLFGKKMREKKEGHVVFISSVAAKDTYEGGSSYCGTKFAMNGYSMAYRADVADTPLRVTCISPGLVETEFSQVRFKGDSEKAAKVYMDIAQLDPQDIADQVVYALTRPRNVQIADIVCYATNQAHAKWCVHRVGPSLSAQ